MKPVHLFSLPWTLNLQTQQMLDIMEKMVQLAGYRYHRMDGSTSVPMRARLIDDFNTNPDVFVFLLTTKVTVGLRSTV